MISGEHNDDVGPLGIVHHEVIAGTERNNCRNQNEDCRDDSGLPSIVLQDELSPHSSGSAVP